MQVPRSLLRADGRSIYQRHGGVRYARVQLAVEERLVVQAGAGAAPDARRRRASTRRRPGDSRTRWPEARWKFKIIIPNVRS